MFEEDFDRCFICQAPSKGLYCSSECRQKDKGSDSPALRATGDAAAPVRLTAQLPVSLSPMVRPVHNMYPSPVFPGRRRGTTSSSSSSLSDDRIQSPQTNPSSTDSPPKEAFDLPPPAYPMPANYLAGSVPVKIPAALASRVPSTPGTGSTTPTTAASIDTLRFGRKSSVTNSVTSPLALTPRCGCGRALGHPARSRETSLKGAVDQISGLSLGPSQTDDLRTAPNSLRMVSDPVNNHHHHHRSAPAPRTPNVPCPILPEDRTSISHVLGSSLLSRSRSDPVHPPSPRARLAAQAAVGIHPRPSLELSGMTPPKVALPAVTPLHGTRSRSAAPAGDDRRGRSRERIQRVDMTPEPQRAQLFYHEEREVAPTKSSRSRVRTSRSREPEGRRYSDERERDDGMERTSRAGTRVIDRDDIDFGLAPGRGRPVAA